jgi:hypothetical protein
MQDSPARMYALVIGVVLIIAGIVGFFVEPSFSGDDRSALLGLLDVNGWHNLVHLASGLLGVMAWRAGAAQSRTYALAFGVIYLVVAIWGFLMGDGETLLGILPVNTEDNVLHLLIALAGLGAYAASSETTTSRTATPAV